MTCIAPRNVATFEEAIQEAIGRPQFDLWFRGHTRLTLGDGTLEIGVPNRFYREWLERHFQEEIRLACVRAFERPLALRFRIDSTLFREVHDRAKTPPSPTARPERPAPAAIKPSRYDIDRFLVGPANKVAHAAATALIERPRQSYSPLFIFGGVGLGKSHLARAIDLGLRRRHRDLQVLFFSGEEFTNEFLHSLRGGKPHAFRRKARHADVLIVDGVQFLAGKRQTQEELLHTLNALATRGGKVVLTADAHPRRLAKFVEELRARFVSGMVAKLDSPNREMRRHIIKDKAAARHLELRPGVLDLLADRLRGNIGEIEGALNYLEHYCDTLAAPIDLATAQAVLGDVLCHSVPVFRIGELIRRACDVFGLHPKSLSERCRSRNVSHPRMLVMYLARKHTKMTYHEIGRQIGGLLHSTAIAADRKIQTFLETDAEISLGDRVWKVREAVEAFERDLGHD